MTHKKDGGKVRKIRESLLCVACLEEGRSSNFRKGNKSHLDSTLLAAPQNKRLKLLQEVQKTSYCSGHKWKHIIAGGIEEKKNLNPWGREEVRKTSLD